MEDEYLWINRGALKSYTHPAISLVSFFVYCRILLNDSFGWRVQPTLIGLNKRTAYETKLSIFGNA